MAMSLWRGELNIGLTTFVRHDEEAGNYFAGETVS